ncbi:MAG: sulfatase [Gemmatales bacterium]|nr:MAG: sulfatase [Gemmatales bacterium]
MFPDGFAILNRREALKTVACGFGYLALRGLAQEAAAAEDPLAPKPPHHTPRAKRVIFIFMQGGPSHVDTFDYKPRLVRDDGKMFEFDDARTLAKTRKIVKHRVMKSPWQFRPYGECGRRISDLFPEIAKHADDLCFLHGMHTEGIAHGPATLFLHTGSINLVRPSVGSWITYGLGTENRNLPGFVTISPSMGNGGPRNYNNAFLPAAYQGTAIGRAGIPIRDAKIRDLVNNRLSLAEQRRQFELLQALNADQLRQTGGTNAELEAVISSFELAFRMQQHAPDVLDLSKESKETLALYGIGEKETDSFGRQCLMARRLSEAGVRYVQINYGDNTNNPAWDQHSNLPKHAFHARATDKPVAGLLEDLKRRGLLDETIVWWGGEFGRTPYAQQNGTGRDHNPDGFTVWLAGGGVKRGFAFGETDEFGHHAIRDKVHMHDLHATILHLLGMDHEKLTYRYAGRDFRLTDVAGRVVHEIIA